MQVGSNGGGGLSRKAGGSWSSRAREGFQGLLWLKQGTDSTPTCPPCVANLTQILLKDSPAGHPAPGLVLGRKGGRLHTDRLDVLVVGDRGGQPQQGQVMGLQLVFGVYDDVLYPVPSRIGLPVPVRRLGCKLPKLDGPLFWIKVLSKAVCSSEHPAAAEKAPSAAVGLLQAQAGLPRPAPLHGFYPAHYPGPSVIPAATGHWDRQIRHRLSSLGRPIASLGYTCMGGTGENHATVHPPPFLQYPGVLLKRQEIRRWRRNPSHVVHRHPALHRAHQSLERSLMSVLLRSAAWLSSRDPGFPSITHSSSSSSTGPCIPMAASLKSGAQL